MCCVMMQMNDHALASYPGPISVDSQAVYFSRKIDGLRVYNFCGSAFSENRRLASLQFLWVRLKFSAGLTKIGPGYKANSCT